LRSTLKPAEEKPEDLQAEIDALQSRLDTLNPLNPATKPGLP
jgi:hypothetical protein